MKLPIVCSQCMKDDIENAMPIAAVEFRDDGRYEVACPKGHRAIVFLQQQKFEILFDIGAYAIADGYHREAVSSFTASLERFYEFFIRALMLQKSIDPEVIDAAWRTVAAQSERQLGAFTLLYTLEFGRPPQLLSGPRIAFRNDVVHKGRIPTRPEALEYGQAILEVVRPILRDAQERFPDGIQKMVSRHLSQSHTAADLGQPAATLWITTIISLSVVDASHHSRSLEQAVAGLRRRPA
jgi:hypothetical protein